MTLKNDLRHIYKILIRKDPQEQIIFNYGRHSGEK